MLTCCCAWLRKGLVGWIAQRLSAVAMLLYFLPMLYVWLMCPNWSLAAWQAWLHQPVLMVLMVINVIGFFVHAYLGLWTVCTDYIHHVCMRTLVLYGLGFYMLAAIFGLFWMLFI